MADLWALPCAFLTRSPPTRNALLRMVAGVRAARRKHWRRRTNVGIMSNLSDLPAQIMAEASNWSDPPGIGEFLIHGVTVQGRPFRPSDWSERLCGVMSCFRPGGATLGRDALI